MARFTGYGQIGSPTAYLMGGGTIGGPNVWNFSSGRPQLSEAARRLGTTMLPSDAFSRQEVRRRQDVAQAIESGRPYVTAPITYRMNQQGKYIDPLTGKSLGTISVNYAAGAWRNIRGEDMPTGGGYSPAIQESRARQGKTNIAGPERSTYTPASSGGPQPAKKASPAKAAEIKKTDAEIKKTDLGESGDPLAFTPFGQRVRNEEPMPSFAGSVTRWWDRSSPAFPYAIY